jgi:hypothetical protein
MAAGVSWTVSSAAIGAVEMDTAVRTAAPNRTVGSAIFIGKPPLFKKNNNKTRMKIPLKPLLISSIIFIGIVLIQVRHFESVSWSIMLLGCIPVLIACFAYPLGNRKMMEVCNDRLDTFQRVLGMTLASIPYWFLLSCYGLASVGLPSVNQVVQSLLVAICSGVIATMLFFFATNLVRHSPEQLAAVEATISIQIIFVILGEVLLLSSPWPDSIALTGIMVIIVGIALHSYTSATKPKLSTVTTTCKLKA